MPRLWCLRHSFKYNLLGLSLCFQVVTSFVLSLPILIPNIVSCQVRNWCVVFSGCHSQHILWFERLLLASEKQYWLNLNVVKYDHSCYVVYVKEVCIILGVLGWESCKPRAGILTTLVQLFLWISLLYVFLYLLLK